MSKKRDYYEVLGIDKNADEKKIKEAYRKAAKKYHPDINKAPDAEEKMREVNHAYEILSDTNKRQMYDNYGHTAEEANYGASPGGGFGNTGAFNDIYEQVYNYFYKSTTGAHRSRKNSKIKGQSYNKVVHISFIDSVLGAELHDTVDIYETCSTCNGTGAASAEDITECSICHGSGTITKKVESFFGAMVEERTCSTCQGTGEKITKKCPTCHGNKIQKTKKTLRIKIPPSIQTGQEVIIKGGGGPGKNGGANGDLYLTIIVDPHKHYRRDNYDIIMNFPVSIKDIIEENIVIVPTPYGEERITLKSSYKNDLIVTLKNKGFAINGSGSKRGSLLLKLKFVIPSLNRKQIRAIAKAMDSVKDNVNANFMKEF